jgi:cyclopropane-fatty-acyl-phospholipid synthase
MDKYASAAVAAASPLSTRRWRWFLLATAGLFGYADGTEWGVSQYRMKAAGSLRSSAAARGDGIGLTIR